MSQRQKLVDRRFGRLRVIKFSHLIDRLDKTKSSFKSAVVAESRKEIDDIAATLSNLL